MGPTCAVGAVIRCVFVTNLRQEMFAVSIAILSFQPAQRLFHRSALNIAWCAALNAKLCIDQCLHYKFSLVFRTVVVLKITTRV
jgi:hypothetical protein